MSQRMMADVDVIGGFLDATVRYATPLALRRARRMRERTRRRDQHRA